MIKTNIEFNPPLPAEIAIHNGKWGLILAHGERTHHDRGIILSLSKKLSEKKISSVRFAFPFRVNGSKPGKDTSSLDEAFKAVYDHISATYPEITWVLCGHGIAAASALRVAPIASDFGEVPPIVCLNYPLYPPNKPDRVDMRALGAIMGEAFFLQGTDSNRGDPTRVRNSIRMMAEHVHVGSIRGANYQLQVKDKTDDRVAYWISNDIDKFLNDLKY